MKIDWHEKAYKYASEANSDYETRLKSEGHLQPSRHVVLKSNLVSKSRPLSAVRQLVELSHRLELIGVNQLGMASESGEVDPQSKSLAIVFDADPAFARQIEDLFFNIYATYEPAWAE